MGGGQPRAIVLHGPGFWTASVLSRSQPCWAVVRRLVGIASAVKLAEEVTSFLSLDDEIRPHETLGQRIPLGMHRGDQHLFRG